MWQSGQIPKSRIQECRGFQRIYQFVIQITLCLKCWAATQMIIKPPSSFEISDPGYLGFLEVKWKPPSLPDSLSQCTVIYELMYNSTITNKLKIIQTKKLFYKDAFNLNEVVSVKIRASLKSLCSNGSQMWSDWKQAAFSAPLQGKPESRIEQFQCIYYNWEYVTCSWHPGKLPSSNSNYQLQYWYEELAHTKTCQTYLTHNGTHTGCMFKKQELRDFTDIFFCVSGIPALSSIRSSYFILQIQDQVKPGPPAHFSASKTSSNELVLEWKPPQGKTPPKCLIYEIQYKDVEGTWQSTGEQRETSRNISSKHVSCARVRGKVTMFCANGGLWSDWSPEKCWEARSHVKVESWVYICLGGVILLLASVYVATTLWRHKVKKKESLEKIISY